MNAHKRNVFGLLFFLYFGAYVVLPLIGTLPSAGASEVVTARTEFPAVAEHFPDFLPMVRGRLVTTNGASAVGFPMKKKRAVLPEDCFAKLFSPDAVSLSGEALHVSYADLGQVLGNPGSGSGDRDHHRLYLGHSPPSA
jgi:hypothetical protein